MSSHFTPAYRLIDLISTKRLSAAELMKSTITRISEINERVNAIISLRDEKYIIAEAEAGDLVPMDQRGVLHGLPIAIKDLANVKGLLTTEGSPIYANRLADEDDIMVFWACGATVKTIVENSKPDLAIVHEPSCMFVTDLSN